MLYSFILPAYNEEKNIKRTIFELSKYLLKHFSRFEIIVVDDGSKDDTFAIAKKIKFPNLHILHLQNNHGKGFALKFGFKKSHGNIIVFMDAGGDFQPAQLVRFTNPLKNNSADIVIGNKWDKRSNIKYPIKRIIFSKIYHGLVELLFRLKIRDTQVGLKAFRREVLENIIPKIKSNGYIFDLELLILAKKNNFKIIENSVILNFTHSGGNIKITSIVKMFVDTVKLKFQR
ncbi:MAG: dolichol-phosphate mannosyltransferase [Candidatus Berkelbacteria bacterium Licking1014_85]|uniref:Dolichol-phosphate mannosyltransferase n=1 Tax=Candidatus Berkelbacteria bacterium Licking1014_85 TaxID=2017148 RepID=A0A554LIH1_9BACT|nr:MAG: dolichol-phosphate mannosyltransferase [Candidatus Berkelbacteria bacterium Licking1014_85]